jgi:hypothetical protein
MDKTRMKEDEIDMIKELEEEERENENQPESEN